jgi:salicylate hydroxylase
MEMTGSFSTALTLELKFLRLATAPSRDIGLTGGPARIRYVAKIVNVDVEEGIAFLDTGEEVKSDLVIGRSSSSSFRFSVLIRVVADGVK